MPQVSGLLRQVFEPEAVVIMLHPHAARCADCLLCQGRGYCRQCECTATLPSFHLFDTYFAFRNVVHHAH